MKEERSKQGHANNKAKQHSTQHTKAVTFQKTNELPRVGFKVQLSVPNLPKTTMFLYIIFFACGKNPNKK